MRLHYIYSSKCILHAVLFMGFATKSYNETNVSYIYQRTTRWQVGCIHWFDANYGRADVFLLFGTFAPSSYIILY